jgi:hypothetical protein
LANGNTAIVLRLSSAGTDRSPGLRHRVPAFDDRDVSALGQLDQCGIGASFLTVIPDELGSQPARLHADDGIGPRIEGVLFTADAHANDVLLEIVGAPGRSLTDDERQEALEAIGLMERRAAQNALEFLVGRARRRCRGWRCAAASGAGGADGASSTSTALGLVRPFGPRELVIGRPRVTPSDRVVLTGIDNG